MLNVVCALIICKGKILATQLGNLSVFHCKWEFPGGKIEKGELSEEALKREIMEELSFEIDILKELAPIEHDYDNIKVNLIPFICRKGKGNLKLTEHIDSGWFTIKELQNLDLVDADVKLIGLRTNQEVLLKYIRKNLN